MTEGSATNTALLVQVLDQLGAVRQEIGGIKSQLLHGARRFDEIGDQINEIEVRQISIEGSVSPLTTSMAIVEPKVKSMEAFLGKKLGPIVAVSSAVVAAALWLIALTIGAAIAWARANLSDHLHWSEWHVSVIAFVCAFIPGYRGSREPPPSPPVRPMLRDIHDAPDGED